METHQTEQTLTLLCEELALDPFTLIQKSAPPHGNTPEQTHPVIDPALLSVTFKGKTCFLGNTLPFRLLTHLAQRPNRYVTHEDLASDVWQRIVSDAAVRGGVKNLRNTLRKAGLQELADAIDGSAYGHYVLKLAR